MKLWNPTEDVNLAMPDNLSEDGKRAYKVIMASMVDGINNPGGCKTFYSPQEWEARGELYGLRSELIVVYDGGDVRTYFEYDGLNDNLMEHMRVALANAGLYHESCTGWYGAIYEL